MQYKLVHFGIKDARVQDVMTLENETYDTILLLMNGAGMCGKLKIPNFLIKLKSLLNPGGQILLDSSDIIYMFDDDEDGGKWIPSDNEYYGSSFNIGQKGEKKKPTGCILTTILIKCSQRMTYKLS
jgi:hypothetical protein